MSNLENLLNAQPKPSVFIVKENSDIVKVFSNHSDAEQFILRRIGVIKQDFLSSSWGLRTDFEANKYKLIYFGYRLFFFYHEGVNSLFEIVESELN